MPIGTNKMLKKKIGVWGENQAALFLEAKKYKILERNWRGKIKGELDLIAQQNELIVFVEIKTRHKMSFGDLAHQAISLKQQQKLLEMANCYLETQNIASAYRFDAIGVTIENNNFYIEHIEDAFHSQW